MEGIEIFEKKIKNSFHPASIQKKNMEDPTFLQDQIREMAEEVARYQKMHESEVNHVAKARIDNEQAMEQLEASTVSVALSEISSREIVSSANPKRLIETRRQRDTRLLKDCTDTVNIAERNLELKLLEKEHERSVRDAKECAAEWKNRTELAKKKLNEITVELSAVPMTERGDLVSVVEKYSEMQTKKRKLMSEMEDMERIHGDKNKIRQEQTERAGKNIFDRSFLD